MKINRVNCVSILELMPRSVDILLRTGATIEEETGDINVKKDTTNVAAHFFLIDQFLEFSRSSGPDQSPIRWFLSVLFLHSLRARPFISSQDLSRIAHVAFSLLPPLCLIVS